MEIIKLNETFSISDKPENGWVMTGSTSQSSSGDIYINMRVSKADAPEEIGDFNYTKTSTSGKANITCNVSESNRDAFMLYSDTVVDTVLSHFSK